MIRRSATLTCLFAALCGTPTRAYAAAPYEGRWTENPAWCANTGGNDEMPVTITRRSIERFASSCRVLSTTRKGATWQIRTSCNDEGQSAEEPRQRETFRLLLKGDRLTIRNSTGVVTLTRCAR